MYGHTLHHGRKRIYSCVQAFSTVEILGSHFNDCFKIKCKQMSRIPRMVNVLDPKIMKEK